MKAMLLCARSFYHSERSWQLLVISSAHTSHAACAWPTNKASLDESKAVKRSREEERVDARGSAYLLGLFPGLLWHGHRALHKHQRLDEIVFTEGHCETEVRAVEENRQAGRRGTNWMTKSQKVKFSHAFGYEICKHGCTCKLECARVSMCECACVWIWVFVCECMHLSIHMCM